MIFLNDGWYSWSFCCDSFIVKQLLILNQGRMAGELNFLTILEVVEVAVEEGVVVVPVVLIWNAMSVVSLGILLVSAVYVVVAVAVVLEEDVAAVLDTAGVQVMVAGLNIETESCQFLIWSCSDHAFVNSSLWYYLWFEGFLTSLFIFRSYSPRGRSPRRRSLSPRGRSFSRSPPYRGREELPYANGWGSSKIFLLW